MVVYTIMFIIALVFTYLSTKIKNKWGKVLFFSVAGLSFFVVAAIRYDVGTDYFFRYVPNYKSFVNGKTIKSLETLFRLLIQFCIIFSKDYAILFVMTSAIIIGLVMTSIYKNSKITILSVVIFFVGSFYFESLNLVRQFISMSIILASYKLLLKDKIIYKILWVVTIIIASLFHSMSIIFLIMIFFNKKVINYKTVIILSIILAIFGGKIPLLIANIIKTTNLTQFTNIDKYVQYTKMEGDLPITTIFVETIVYIFIYKLYANAKKNNVKMGKEAAFFVNLQSIAILSTIMNIHILLFFRITLMFSFFQILSIPYFVYLNKGKNLPFFRYSIKNGVTMFTIIVILSMSVRMIYSNVIKGADEVLPYKTIFTRSK